MSVGVTRERTRERTATAGVGAVAIVKKVASFAEWPSQANSAASLDQGWDDVADAPNTHIGGFQDGTGLALSGQQLAWHYFNLWLLGIQII